MERLLVCNASYARIEDVWHYAWGEEVPGAIDLTLEDLMRIDDQCACVATVRAFRPVTEAEHRWLGGDLSASDQVLLRRRPGYRPHVGDLIIGLLAPELHPLTMLTVGEVAEATEVSKSTIDSYRYRGYLPEPQVTRGRTPLWARPIIRHWLATRPGPGWRTDIYDTKRCQGGSSEAASGPSRRGAQTPSTSPVAGR